MPELHDIQTYLVKGTLMDNQMTKGRRKRTLMQPFHANLLWTFSLWSVAVMGIKQCAFDTLNYQESRNVLSFKLSVKEQCIFFHDGRILSAFWLRLIPMQIHCCMA